MINWKSLTTEEIFTEITKDTSSVPYLIFKHSTSCSISAAALSRLERTWNEAEVAELVPVYLDLLKYRSISNKIAQDLNVIHESPQVIVVKNGKAIYDNSHMGINFAEIKNIIKK